jgi:hypothetical protein
MGFYVELKELSNAGPHQGSECCRLMQNYTSGIRNIDAGFSPPMDTRDFS